MRMGRRGPGLIGTMARTAVIAGTATAVSGSIRDKQMMATQQKMAEQQAAQQPAQQPAQQEAAPAAPATSGGLSEDAISKLKQLADLHAQGILTDEEFAEQKARVLAG